MENVKNLFTKKVITIIVMILVILGIGIGGYNYFNSGSITGDLTDGTYQSEEVYDGKYMTLDVDGNEVVITFFGRSATGKIDRSKKEIELEDEDEIISYKMVARKLILTISNYSVPLVKKDSEGSAGNTEENTTFPKTEDSDTLSSEASNSDTIVTEEEVREVIENTIGLSSKLTHNAINDLESKYDYDLSIYDTYYDTEGNTVYNAYNSNDGWKLSKILSIIKKDDNKFTVKLLLEK